MLLIMVGGLYAFTENDYDTQIPITEEKKTADIMNIWYTDEELTDYINSAALDYDQCNGIKVIPHLVAGGEYLEGINHSTMQEADDFPDLFIISNDSLEKAAVAGLASRLTQEESWFVEDNFPATSMNAVTWDGHLIAFPFYFETSFLLYNKTLLNETAGQIIKEELNNQSAMQNEGDGESNTLSDIVIEDEKILEKAEAIRPRTIEAIMNFANDYDVASPVETVFKWDVSDIFYNYFFAGNYLNIGGVTGDDSSIVDLYNTNAMTCLLWYQRLNQFFSIEASEVNYESVMDEFVQGKVLFTIATTDAVAKLEQAQKDGTFPYTYEVTSLPGITESLSSRGLNVTSSVVINEYSLHREEAAAFAELLVCGQADTLYQRTGRMSACSQLSYDNPSLSTILTEYGKSVPLPKMMRTSNYWVLLEQCYTSVWQGSGVNESLRNLSEQMKMQIAGEAVTEAVIDTPVLENEE